MVLADSSAALFNAACAGIATVAAVYVALRDGRWRKTGLAAQLSARITAAQKAADGWHETPQADSLRTQLAIHAKDIAHHKVEVGRLATRDDVVKLGETVAGQTERLNHTAAGVDRIESLLIRRALDGDHR